MAISASQKAHAPYSKFYVGAAILTGDGRFYSGCNIENASYPEGWCAETSAISHMVMDGGGTIAEMAVFCPQMEKVTPCGGCCQRISEFGDKATIIHLCDSHGIAESIPMGDLLPKSFNF
jgi:cytidine deaminase